MAAIREDTLRLRPATNRDSDQVIALIGAVYGEYGERICLHAVDADLLALEDHYGPGLFQVLEDGAKIHGTVALTLPEDEPERCYLKRLYLAAHLRGTGWGERMLQWAMDTGRRFGRRRMEFWTDVRFTRAHAFYEKLGFEPMGAIRTMDDAWEPYRELRYGRDL